MMHIVCVFRGLAKKPNWELKPIAQNPEKYMALFANFYVSANEKFSVRFIDSCQLLNSSLDTLVHNLVGGSQGMDKLVHSRQMIANYNALTMDMIAAKGIFPYCFLDSWAKMTHPTLPTFGTVLQHIGRKG